MNHDEKEILFNDCLISLGYGVRKVELTDEQLEVALKMAIRDYSEIVQNFLIESQWSSLYGADVSSTDFSFALSVQTHDYLDKFKFAYSKQVGLQSKGPWELKKDFVELEPGKQVYQIPANREINQVLWMTPPTTDMALFANYGGSDRGFAGGLGSVGSMPGAANNQGFFIAPAFDVLTMAQDLGLKQRLTRGDLTYKITAGPDGTRLLHLLNAETSPFLFNRHGRLNGGKMGLNGCVVWYYYYDTTGKSTEDCRKDNPDIIMLPNEVPLAELDYTKFNSPTKNTIRRLFVAKSKQILGYNRGKFSGTIGPEQAQQKMDYEMFLNDAKEERNEVIEELKGRLERFMPQNLLNRMADEAEALNRQLKYNPIKGIFLI